MALSDDSESRLYIWREPAFIEPCTECPFHKYLQTTFAKCCFSREKYHNITLITYDCFWSSIHIEEEYSTNLNGQIVPKCVLYQLSFHAGRIRILNGRFSHLKMLHMEMMLPLVRKIVTLALEGFLNGALCVVVQSTMMKFYKGGKSSTLSETQKLKTLRSAEYHAQKTFRMECVNRLRGIYAPKVRKSLSRPICAKVPKLFLQKCKIWMLQQYSRQ